MFREVDKMRKEVLGERHEDALNCKPWLAICLYYKQQFYNAELMFREVKCLHEKQQFDNAYLMFRD